MNVIYSVLLKFTTKNPHIKKVLVDKYGMHVYTMSGRTKGSIVERFNRTIKQRIGRFDLLWNDFQLSLKWNYFFTQSFQERYFTENKTHNWYSVLQDITRNINNTVNRSIGMAPSKVTPDKAELIRERLYSPPDQIEPCKLEIGDNVRIPRIKNIHAKGYTQSE